MSVIVFERALSPNLVESVEQPEVERLWRCYDPLGGTSETAVRAALEAVIPHTMNSTNQLLIFQNYSIRHVGAGVWEALVRYGKQMTKGSTAEPFADTLTTNTYQFEIGTQTQHITQSKSTVNKYAPAGQTAPDCHGSIGVNGDEVSGCDIDVPTFSWSETWYISQALITPAYKLALFAVASSPVNNATFRGFPEGEVRFLGASGTPRDTLDEEITFRFIAGPNTTTLMIGSGANQIGPVDKRAWEYLWVRYSDNVDSNQLVKVPVAAYVEQVYDESDFSQLGIGT